MCDYTTKMSKKKSHFAFLSVLLIKVTKCREGVDTNVWIWTTKETEKKNKENEPNKLLSYKIPTRWGSTCKPNQILWPYRNERAIKMICNSCLFFFLDRIAFDIYHYYY